MMLNEAGAGPESSATCPGPARMKSDGVMVLRVAPLRLTTFISTVKVSPTATVRGLVTMLEVRPAVAAVRMLVVLELEAAEETGAPEYASVPAALPLRRTVPATAPDVL